MFYSCLAWLVATWASQSHHHMLLCFWCRAHFDSQRPRVWPHPATTCSHRVQPVSTTGLPSPPPAATCQHCSAYKCARVSLRRIGPISPISLVVQTHAASNLVSKPINTPLCHLAGILEDMHVLVTAKCLHSAILYNSYSLCQLELHMLTLGLAVLPSVRSGAQASTAAWWLP